MHALHKILVYIPDVVSNPDRYTRRDLIKEIRDFAEMNTEHFQYTVFDYRETDTAGSWQTRYPVNVLFAKDNKAKFLQELTDTKDLQHKAIHNNLADLKKLIGTDLEEIVLELKNPKSGHAHTEKPDSMAAYCLYQIAVHLNGTYVFDSHFYNLNEHRARIYEEDLAEIESTPDDWALVLFDYHN